MKTIKVRGWKEIPTYFTGIVEYLNGTKKWFKNGLLHRLDGPAVEYANGTKEWFKNGKRHREDGPALKFSDSIKYWYLEGKSYGQINLKDYVVLDSYQGNHNLVWYKLLDKDQIIDYPDIPGLITKE